MADRICSIFEAVPRPHSGPPAMEGRFMTAIAEPPPVPAAIAPRPTQRGVRSKADAEASLDGGAAAPAPRPKKPRVTAESMAAKQRDISVSEFFAKNRHLLGFDNPRKALLTTVKEAVDNSLDACEEAGILPDITVVIEDLQPERGREVKQSRYRITVVDNGPGIMKAQVEHIFGRLLY